MLGQGGSEKPSEHSHLCPTAPGRAAPGGVGSPSPLSSLPPAGWQRDPPATSGGPGRRRIELPRLPAPGRSPRCARSSCCGRVSCGCCGQRAAHPAHPALPCPRLASPSQAAIRAPTAQRPGSQPCHGIPGTGTLPAPWCQRVLHPSTPGPPPRAALQHHALTPGAHRGHQCPSLEPGLVTSPGAGQRARVFPPACSQPCLLSLGQIRAAPPWLRPGKKRIPWTSSEPSSGADQRYPWPLL